MFRLIAVFTLVAMVSGGVLQTQLCPDSEDASLGFLEEVYSPNFDGNEEIVLHSGQSYSFGIKFYAGFGSSTLVPKIYALINGIPASWNGAGNNACTNLIDGGNCPLTQDGYYHYYADLKVPSVGNLDNVVFQWALKDKVTNGQSQVCFRMTVDIKST